MLWETPSPWLVQHFHVLKKHVFKFWTPLFKTLWEAEVAAVCFRTHGIKKSEAYEPLPWFMSCCYDEPGPGIDRNGGHLAHGAGDRVSDGYW